MNCILVIDDDPSVRNLAQLVLKTEGFEVHVASNGLEGLEKIEATHPVVVVLDLQMPVMDGATLFRRIDGPDRPPVVVMSAYGAERVSKDLGAEAFIPKPYNPIDLMETVRKLAVRP